MVLNPKDGYKITLFRIVWCANLLYMRKCLVRYFIFQKVVKWCSYISSIFFFCIHLLFSKDTVIPYSAFYYYTIIIHPQYITDHFHWLLFIFLHSFLYNASIPLKSFSFSAYCFFIISIDWTIWLYFSRYFSISLIPSRKHLFSSSNFSLIFFNRKR